MKPQTVFGSEVPTRVVANGLFEITKSLYQARCECSNCKSSQYLSSYAEIPYERIVKEFLDNGWDLLNRLCPLCKENLLKKDE